MRIPHLPQELLEAIVDCLHDDLPTLKVCSTAFPAFRLPCRKHIFARVTLERCAKDVDNHHQVPYIVQRFHQLTSDIPEVGRYVRELDIHADMTWDVDDGWLESWLACAQETLPLILQKLTHLTTLHIRASCAWVDLPPIIKASFYKLFQLPALVHVDLLNIYELPVSLFSTFRSLKHLTLGSVEMVDGVTASDLCPARKTELDSLTVLVRGLPMISNLFSPQSPLGVSGLRMLTIQLLSLGPTEPTSSFGSYWNFLQPCADSLECLRITLPRTLSLDPTQTIDLNRLTSLRSFSVRITTFPGQENTFVWLTHTLSTLRRCTSVLGDLTIILYVRRAAHLNLKEGDWAVLDGALVDLELVGRIRVTVNAVVYGEDYRDQQAQGVFGQVVEEGLPRSCKAGVVTRIGLLAQPSF